jgi:two-component system response regulator FlrC
MNSGTILIVEDDPSLAEALSDTLELSGYPVVSASDGNAALEILGREPIGLVVSDVRMRPMDGHTLLKRIRVMRPELPVVLMTAFGTIDKAVQAMQDGAADYLVKPFEAELLVDTVGRHLPVHNVSNSDGAICVDRRSVELHELAGRVAQTDVTVLISGESGSGKEVIAQHIHRTSQRVEGPFVAINCAAIPENMLEALLFGYEKGAFTGAHQANPGKFEQAQGGTILLDEISEMELGLQAKLLRVLQEREVERIGGRKPILLDVRVIATTNRDLREMVREGKFREDLYYRLSVFPLRLAPLRERPEDIVPLTEHLIARHHRDGGPVPRLTEQARSRLQGYRWPGNVRELDNVVQRALILRRGDRIDLEQLVFEGGESGWCANRDDRYHETAVETAIDDGDERDESEASLGRGVREHEYNLILKALGEGSRKAAAERLGISPRTLRYKIARMRDLGYGIPGEAA